MMKTKNIKLYFVLSALIFVVAISFHGCKKDPAPVNPYDSVDYGTNDSEVVLDQYSIAALHRDIFFPQCGKPGCHDGHFEPDFRTVESTYSTMVYQPITKNNANNDFTFRVLPYQSAKSVLYERISNCCFVNTNDRMPQDNIGIPMNQVFIDRIKKWIDNGAPNLDAAAAKYPNKQPFYQAMVALDDKFPAQFNAISDKVNRVNNVEYYAFYVTSGQTFTVLPGNYDGSDFVPITDDSTATENLTQGVLKLSYKKDDFSSPVQSVAATKLVVTGKCYWYSTINSAGLLTDTTVYMRFYIKDADHTTTAEFPTNQTIDPYKTFWSFYVKP
jgi:hypothetical protein